MTENVGIIRAARRWWRWNFLSVGGGSSDVLFGIKIFGNRYYRKPWFQHTVYRAYRIARRIHDAKMWVKYRTTRRDCWDVPTPELKPGYYDCDTLMLHGCMGLLCRYVEDECGGDKGLEKFTQDLMKPGSEGYGPRELVDAQAEHQSEAIKIYRWWKVERPRDRARYDELLHELYGKRRRMKTKPVMDGKLHEITFDPFKGEEVAMHEEFEALKEKIDDDEQKMLHHLIDIRGSLWT